MELGNQPSLTLLQGTLSLTSGTIRILGEDVAQVFARKAS